MPLLFLVLFALMALPAQAASVTVIEPGRAEVDGELVVLDGIDPPGYGQRCLNIRRAAYFCGRDAMRALERRMLRHGGLSCENGICRDARGDINEWAVREGWALAKGPRYANAEAEAREGKRGLWAGKFTPPAEWRAGERLAEFRGQLIGVRGRDSRLTVNATDYPWRVIGRLNVQGRGFCTGVLVAPNKVATAAHCLWSKRSGRWLPLEEIFFTPGYQRGDFIDHAAVIAVDRDQSYRVNPNRADPKDWAVLTLDKPIGNTIGYVGWGTVEPGTKILQAGYSRDKRHVLTANPACKVLRKSGGLLFHDCDSLPGDSGSPLLALTPGGFKLVAVHVAIRGGGAVTGVASDGPNFIPTLNRAAAPNQTAFANQASLTTAQQLLDRLGYEPGRTDGKPATQTSDLLKRFQAANGLAANGAADLSTVRLLFAALKPE